MQSDWADAALRRQVLRHARTVRARYEQLVTQAVAQGELRSGTDARTLARMIEVTLGGSLLAWTLHREVCVRRARMTVSVAAVVAATSLLVAAVARMTFLPPSDPLRLTMPILIAMRSSSGRREESIRSTCLV